MSDPKPVTVLTVVELCSGIFMVHENGRAVLDDMKYVGRDAAVDEARRRARSKMFPATFAE